VGPRPSIFAMKPHHSRVETLAPHQLYFRDEVKIQGLTLDRPFDFGGDDQKRLQTSLPILIDTLPRKALTASQNILCIRAAYGALPLICRTRYPEANVVAIERDLLGTSFIQHNAEKLNLSGERLEIREAQIFSEALKPHEKFDLILGELSPSAGEAVALHELNTMKDRLKKGGQALILCLEKNEKDWVRKFAETQRTVVARVLTRENYSVVRIENT
jgi:precorrin-6B methylase 2